MKDLTFDFIWDEVSKLDGWVDNDIVAEHGALAIAFFVIQRVTDFTVVRQSRKKTGFDYWLGYKKEHVNYDPQNFLLARLEISGIFNGTEQDVKSRVKKKMDQVNRSASLNLPAYISVTEFGKCNSVIMSK